MKKIINWMLYGTMLFAPLLIWGWAAQSQLPQVTVVGAVTPGDCTKFLSTLQIADNGVGCGGTAGTFTVPGANNFLFQGNGGANTLFQINGSTTAVNFLTATPGNTGNVVILGAAGSDPSVPIQLNTKGSGSVFLTVGGQNSLVISSAGAHLGTSTGAAPAPTANSCAGFVLSSGTNDNEGRITFTSATTCSVNFGTAFVAAPFCSIMPNSAPSTVQVTTTTGGFAATFGTAQTSLQWICKGT